MIPRRFLTRNKRNHKKEVEPMQSITVGLAGDLSKLHGGRFLLNDGKVVGFEESISIM